MADTSKVENLMAALGRLSKRERIMVAGVGVTFVIFVAFMVGWWVSSSLGSLERRIESKTKRLQTLIDKRQEFEEAKRTARRAEQIMREGGKIQLMGDIEDLASRLGVNVEDMAARTPSVNTEANMSEEKVEVNISLITIDRLVDFLKELERKSQTIAVRKLHIKQSFQQPDQLEVGFTVSNFKLLDESKVQPDAAPKRPARPSTKRPSTAHPTKG